MDEISGINPELNNQVNNNAVLPEEGDDAEVGPEGNNQDVNPLGQGNESNNFELHELGQNSQENADPKSNESLTYTKSLKIRDAAYQEAQELFDNGEINDEELLVRMSLIDAEFFTNMAMGLNLSEDPTFNEVSAALGKYYKADLPPQLLMAHLQLVQEAMDYLESQDYLNGKSLTLKGAVEIQKILGDDLPEDIELNRDVIEKLLSDRIPYKLVVARFSNEVRVEELFKEKELNIPEQPLDEDILAEVETEIDETLNEADSQSDANDGSGAENGARVVGSEEEKTTVKRKAWSAVKAHMLEGLSNSDATELMKLFLGMDVRDQMSRFTINEDESLLNNGQQVGGKDIDMATENGSSHYLKSLLIDLMNYFKDKDIEAKIGKSIEQVEFMDDEEFRNFSRDGLSVYIIEMFNSRVFMEDTFNCFKKWLLNKSASSSEKKGKWRDNLFSSGVTSNALKQLVEHYNNPK